MQFIDKVKGGRIPREYIPSVEKGFKAALANGPLAGYPLDSLKVVLLDGSFHPVDSDALAFELAAKIASRGAVLIPLPILSVTRDKTTVDILGKNPGSGFTIDDKP